jgi:hypothetical protein
MTPTVLIPAYGRKYSTGAAAVEAYLEGKDFKLLGGPYCSARDFPNETVFIRIASGLYVDATFKL